MKSKHFPELDRLQPPHVVADIFKKTLGALANDRCNGRGFTYGKTGAGGVIYDIDICYEEAFAAGSAKKQSA